MSGDDEKLSEAELDRLIKGDTAHTNFSEQKDADDNKKERIADKLIKIAIEKSYRESDSPPDAGGLFHTSDRVAYADVDILGWRETWPVRSRGFRYWLVRI
jgi:hypothetical protein